VNFREECHWSHACLLQANRRTGSNGIHECKTLFENSHRTNAGVFVCHQPRVCFAVLDQCSVVVQTSEQQKISTHCVNPFWIQRLAADLQDLGRNLQCEPVRRVYTREDCHWSHAWQHFKRIKGVKLNGILECKFMSKNAHRTCTNCCLPSTVLLSTTLHPESNCRNPPSGTGNRERDTRITSSSCEPTIGKVTNQVGKAISILQCLDAIYSVNR
jgi:hypothetical protein